MRFVASAAAGYRAGAFDVVLVETAINDRAALLEPDGRAQVLAATERLARAVLAWPGAPALVFLHLFRRDKLPLAPQTAADAARAVQWDPTQEHTQFVAAYYDVPSLSWRDAVWHALMAQRALQLTHPVVGGGESLLATTCLLYTSPSPRD